MGTVQFFRPMPVTNAACCSDSRVMCERCATAALNAGSGRPGGAELTANARGRATDPDDDWLPEPEPAVPMPDRAPDLVAPTALDPDDWLPVPVLNFGGPDEDVYRDRPDLEMW